MKIAGSGENGVHQEQCLNRNAKLVLAATGSVNKFAVPPKIKSPTEGKSKLYSMHIAQQMAPQVKKVKEMEGNNQSTEVPVLKDSL